MKIRFVTTLEPKTVEKLKIIAAKEHKPVNAIIEELVNNAKEK